ncbi:hypothetical protein OIU14_12820 [Thalassobacter stenotrophicus]|uniref:hypothetical protein n=1 Tax=Thalassobacter stenotrophicus TaxID=266809 RepID=UPI0022A94932|nr:hypothetical protein [Thalassobacter stenotrophicus]UYP67356.1 hypothetical protein OIU14_12820 [Thalassobacter stenotrophicus]
MKKLIAFTCVITAILLAGAAETENAPPTWLFVQTANNMASANDTITLPFEREVFAFTDRPYRAHGHLGAHDFAALWNSGENDFKENPPNAVLTWVDNKGIQAVEIQLLNASLDDNAHSISYNVTYETGGQLPTNTGPVSLFIDNFIIDTCLLVGVDRTTDLSPTQKECSNHVALR